VLRARDSDGNEAALAVVRWGAPPLACEAWQDAAELAHYVSPSSSAHVSLSLCLHESNAAWQETLPTPGSHNDCQKELRGDGTPSTAIACPHEPADVRLSEVRTRPAELAFVELEGAPGQALSCVRLVGHNVTADGACTEYGALSLHEHSLPSTGRALILPPQSHLNEPAWLVDRLGDPQNGPDVLMLTFGPPGAEVILDAVAYGAELAHCVSGVSRPLDALPPEDSSIVRCHLTAVDQPARFRECHVPSPGSANVCLCAHCGEAPPRDVTLEQVQVAPSADAFVEVATGGEPVDGCIELVAYNGGADGTGCEPYARYPWELTKPAGPQRWLWHGISLQRGPDALALEWTGAHGQTAVLDWMTYGGALPACADRLGVLGLEGPRPEAGEALIRCSGASRGWFAACPDPSPGVPSACDCSESSPPLASEPAPLVGCASLGAQHSAELPGALGRCSVLWMGVLALFVCARVLRPPRARGVPTQGPLRRCRPCIRARPPPRARW
jgi:hypothetical protein